MSELKPCPFCGGKGGYDHGLRNGATNRACHWVRCIACSGRGSLVYSGEGRSMKEARQAAIAAWNRGVK